MSINIASCKKQLFFSVFRFERIPRHPMRSSSNWLAPRLCIVLRTGSYAKLMKAYYGKENNASKTAASPLRRKTATETGRVKKMSAGAKVETATDASDQESADTLLWHHAVCKNDHEK